jgi:hypothetical protein
MMEPLFFAPSTARLDAFLKMVAVEALKSNCSFLDEVKAA